MLLHYRCTRNAALPRFCSLQPGADYAAYEYQRGTHLITMQICACTRVMLCGTSASLDLQSILHEVFNSGISTCMIPGGISWALSCNQCVCIVAS
jgi:hypothetical protein